MARPEKCRRVCNPPKMEGYMPYGITAGETGSVFLKFEEYESIRLVNYKMLPHDKAAEQMNISRPTFTRIYNKALKQIAISFVEGKGLVFEGGNYIMEKEWFRCKKCFKLIQGKETHLKCKECKSYGTDELLRLNTDQTNQ